MGWVYRSAFVGIVSNCARRLSGSGFGRGWHLSICCAAIVGCTSIPAVVQAAPGDPEIDVWQGPSQHFGNPGVPQKVYNILGRVTDDTFISSFSYTINGGSSIPLSIGPDTYRLQNEGDFNIDINRDNLNVGVNIIDITAVDSQSNTTVVSVSLNYTPQNTWPLPYNINWDNVNELTDVVQVVDGIWDYSSNGARILEWGYDRILAVGDLSWTDYEITVPITVHSHDILDLGFPSIGPGVGFVNRWQGHSNWQGRQPNIGWLPMGASFWYDFSDNDGTFSLHGDGGTLVTDQTGLKIQLGTTYLWKFRCETQPSGYTFYGGKVWEMGQPEPPGWLLTGSDGLNDLQNGCVLLIPHHVDATFGDVTVVPVGPGSSLAISNLQVIPFQNSAQVTWSTNQPADSSVAYGTTSGYELGTESSSSLVSTHNITLNNLQPNTLYHIQATSENASMESASSGDFTFTTLGPRTITTNTSGSGSVVLTPDQPTYQDNDVVDVEAVASNGWMFVNWQGDLDGNTNPTQLTVSGDMNVTAVFTDDLDTNGPVISNVQVSAGATSAQVTWTTDELSDSSVAYGPTAAYEDGSVSDSNDVTNHAINLSNLSPETTYHYQITSTDAFSNSTQTVDAVFMTTAGVTSGLVSDDFSSGPLNTNIWTFVNPTGNSSLNMTGTQAEITVEAGILHSMYGGGNRLPPRIMQNVQDADFQMEVSVESFVTEQFQTHGILAEQDADNYVYFEILSNGGQMQVYVESVLGGSGSSQAFFTIGSTNLTKMRLDRTGDFWTFEYSTDDGQNWFNGAAFTTQLNITAVGVYAGNDSFSGVDSPEYTAIFDYVFNLAGPIDPEDGSSLCSGVDCSGFDGDCVVGVCNPGTGACETAPANEGGACDDGVNCTTSDVCSNGLCIADPVDCSGLDDACNVGICNEGLGTCEATPANESGACDDLDPCTINDACTNGTCAGVPKDCSALDGPCTIGVCNGTTGECEAAPANEDQSCDDGLLCTTDDACSNGLCEGDPVDCTSLDGQCSTGVCNPTSGACEANPINEGLGCDDGDLCTETDICAAGTCGGAAVDCSSLDDDCNAGTCNPSTGTCEAAPVNEGGGCDDGDLCTTLDACTNGVCAGEAVDCSGLDDSCLIGACNASTGACEALPANEGGACDDGDNCTIGDACSNGICDSEPLDCSGLDDACNLGVCNETLGTCETAPANEGGTCDDLNPCTENDSCASGVCAGTPKDCSSLDSACSVGVCNASTGVCEALPANEGNNCDDGDNCTMLDACTNGVCAGAAVDCSGLNDGCNVGACNAGTGFCEAIPANEGGGCDDGDLCTTLDACTNGVCVGSAVDCSSLDDQCLVGACNPSTGVCESVSANEGGICSDGDLCTTNDACTNGLCEGEFVDCSGLDDDCNLGVCASSTGFCEQVAVNESGGCDDGDLCTENDACADGICEGTTVDCSGLDGMCQTGICDGGSGQCVAQLAADGTSCDDGDLCTDDDECTGGSCAGTSADCSGLDDQCNVGTCNASTGACEAVPTNEGQLCDDGIDCTFDETCTSGACSGTLEDCDGDGVCDGDDNCLSVANPLQENADEDGFGDACDQIFDFDHDGDIDLDDLGEFADCVSGAGFNATLNCQDAFDNDGDGDVDLFDWAVFQTAFTGPTAITCP